MDPISAPRGANDIHPPESAAWNALEANAREIAGRFGYGEIRKDAYGVVTFVAKKRATLL